MIPVSSILILAAASLVGSTLLHGVIKGFLNWLAVILMTAFLYAAFAIGCIL
jgi:hypothetical protein